jgi:hypothetical protein
VPPPAAFINCGWLTRGRFLFFACAKKRNQKKGDPDGATTPARTRLCLGGVPTAHPCPDGPRAGSIPAPFQALGQRLASLGRAIRGPTSPSLNVGASRVPVAAARASQPAAGDVASPVFEPEARGSAPGELSERRWRRDAQGGVGGFRGKTVLVTFAKTKVTRGCRGRSTPLVAVKRRRRQLDE